MMETITYTASRLAEGNRLFPASITLSEEGLIVRFPFLLSGKEVTILYNKVSAVKFTSPIIGFSDMIIDTTWRDSFRVHGYTMNEVKHIKGEILRRVKSNWLVN